MTPAPPDYNPRPQITPPSQNPLPTSSQTLHPSQSNGSPVNIPNSIPVGRGQPSAVNLFRILTLCAIGMAVLLSLLPAVGHDQLWCLYVAQQILYGTKLYGPQLLESNPPLIMAMLTIPAALSHLLHVPVTFLFKLAVLLTEVVSALSALFILRSAKILLTPGRLWSFAFAFITIFTVLPARDLGQRDHLLAILCLPYVLSCLPYVLSAALDSQRNASSPAIPLTLPFRILIGFLAGLGICLKPHHILIPVAIELYLLLKTRSLRHLLRPTFLALIATGVAFLAAIRLLTPAYLTDVVPLLKDVYWAIGHLTLPQLLAASLQLHILAALCVALYLYLKPVSPLPLLLILSGAASTIAYYLQGTGWYYQQIPAISFFACSFWVLLMELATQSNLTSPNWTPKAALALTILSFVLTAHFSGYTLAHPLSYPSGLSDIPDPSFFANLPPGAPIAILSTVVDDTVPPITTHHLFMAQRTNNLWVLPAILRNENPTTPPQHFIPPTRLAELDRLQHQWMVEDLNRWHPTLILVLRCEDPTVQCQILEDRHDNLLAWFQRDPAFRAAFAPYRFQRSSGPYDAYLRP